MSEAAETFFDTGILFGHFHYDRLLRHAQGHAFWNYPSGMRLIDGYYTCGIRSGRWREFTEDGSVLSVTELGDGEYIKDAAVPKLAEANIFPETTILLEEEYGFRHWFWLPDRPLSELLNWWRGVFSVEPWFLSPSSLPGVLIEAADSCERWHRLFDSRLYIYGHIHEDDDSELRSPSGEVIHHRGHAFTAQHSTA